MEMIINKEVKLSSNNFNMHTGVKNVLNKFYNDRFIDNVLINFAKLFNYIKYIVKKLFIYSL